jgi:AmmeMemoRadiSam system protein A
LRGCLGEFEPKEPLSKVIQKMTLAAATEDIRFMPVQAKELKDIKIEVSVMTPKRKIDDWREIQLGKHGVVVQKGDRAGTFLPQVATETGWGLEEFLSHLCAEKAGLPQDCYKDSSTSLFVFEAQIVEEE